MPSSRCTTCGDGGPCCRTSYAPGVYEPEGHDVQYRHWDQILTDVAWLGERVVVCAQGRTVLVGEERAERLLASGGSWACAHGSDLRRVRPGPMGCPPGVPTHEVRRRGD